MVDYVIFGQIAVNMADYCYERVLWYSPEMLKNRFCN